MSKFFIHFAHKAQKLLYRNKNTIIISLVGGLGNQLFQYAFAKLLEEKLNKNVVLDGFSKYVNDEYKRTCLLSNFQIKLKIIDDLDGFSRYIHNEYKTTYSLSNFQIKFKVIDDRLLNGNPPFNESKEMICLDQRKSKYNIVNCIREFNQLGLIYAEGYWQSAKLVNLCRQKLLADIKLVHKASNEYYELRKEISYHKNSTAIHFRQCWNIDYSRRESSKTMTEKHIQNALPLEYYKRAINLVRKYKKDTIFFVFADNTNKAEILVAKILPKSDYRVIHRRSNIVNDYEDLLLIAQCQNHIMSNSTFSWWGAWLSWAKIPPEENKNMYIMTNDWDTNGKKTPITEELTFSPNIIHL